MITPLNLDQSLSTPDMVARNNTNGAVRFINETDTKDLSALQRLQNDLVMRDTLMMRKVNEIIASMNLLSGGSGEAELPPGGVPDPVQASDPSNKSYVDERDRVISRGLALLTSRVNGLNSTSMYATEWTDVQWQSGAKAKFSSVLLDSSGASDSVVDFANAVSVTLLIRADVSSVGISNRNSTPSYVYRSVTFGQTTGFKLDDVYFMAPNVVSFLLPFTSLFAVYPPTAAYNATQPSSISIRAIVTTTRTLLEAEAVVPGLTLLPEELAIIVSSVIEALATDDTLLLKFADATQEFNPLALRRPDGTLAKTTGVLANDATLRIASAPSATVSKMVGQNAAGDLVRPSCTATDSRDAATGLWLTGQNGDIFKTDSLLVPVFESKTADGLIVHRAKVADISTTLAIDLDPDTLVSKPTWATRVKLSVVTSCHSADRTLVYRPCAVRVFTNPTTGSPDLVSEAVVEWDYGNGVVMKGIAGFPYQAHTQRDVWVDLVGGKIKLNVNYSVVGNGPWGLCIISLLAYGR